MSPAIPRNLCCLRAPSGRSRQFYMQPSPTDGAHADHRDPARPGRHLLLSRKQPTYRARSDSKSRRRIATAMQTGAGRAKPLWGGVGRGYSGAERTCQDTAGSFTCRLALIASYLSVKAERRVRRLIATETCKGELELGSQRSGLVRSPAIAGQSTEEQKLGVNKG